MSDIWDEKPVPFEYHMRYSSEWFYDRGPMDVWLEKLKCQWSVLQTKDYIDEKIAEGLLIDKTLEAIKKWRDKWHGDPEYVKRFVADFGIVTDAWRQLVELNEILESSEFTTKGEE